MGTPFSDITVYAPTSFKKGSPEFSEEACLINYVSDLYVQKMHGYKPPKTTRITIQPAYYNIWNRTWRNGSLVSIAPFFSHEDFVLLDKKGKYKCILDLIQTATLQLSEEYNWDKAVFLKAYSEIIESDFEFKIAYPAKLSRDKTKTCQVVIKKTEQRTYLNLLFKMGDIAKEVKLFENRNWFWYDIAYEMAKNTKWLDNNTFGVYSKKHDKYGYYSFIDDVVIGKLDFQEVDFRV